MLLVGLVLFAPGLLCFVIELREPSPENVIKGLLFWAAAIGLLLVFFGIRRMIPRRHG